MLPLYSVWSSVFWRMYQFTGSIYLLICLLFIRLSISYLSSTVLSRLPGDAQHFATTSYVSPAMAALEEDAKKAGVVMINECGVDPGQCWMSVVPDAWPEAEDTSCSHNLWKCSTRSAARCFFYYPPMFCSLQRCACFFSRPIFCRSGSHERPAHY